MGFEANVQTDEARRLFDLLRRTPKVQEGRANTIRYNQKDGKGTEARLGCSVVAAYGKPKEKQCESSRKAQPLR
jgi:hypothetical protein